MCLQGDSAKTILVLKELIEYELSERNTFGSDNRIIMDIGSSAPNAVRVRAVPVDVHSRYLGMAGNACLNLGDMEGAIRFFADTMRVNLAGGLAFHANIRTKGYDFVRFESCGTRLPAAPAA